MLRFLFLIECGLVEFVFVFWICCNTVLVLCFGFLALRHVGSWLPNQGLNPHTLHGSPVQSLSHVWLFATPWTATHQASLSFTNSWSLLRLNVHWVSDAIQPSHPLSSPCPPAFNLSQHQGLFKWVSPLHQVAKILVSASASVLKMNIQDWFPLDGLVGSPCSPRDSQVSSPTPLFKSVNSLVLSFIYSLTLTSVHDYWESHSFDYMDLCQQSNVSAF